LSSRFSVFPSFRTEIHIKNKKKNALVYTLCQLSFEDGFAKDRQTDRQYAMPFLLTSTNNIWINCVFVIFFLPFHNYFPTSSYIGSIIHFNPSQFPIQSTSFSSLGLSTRFLLLFNWYNFIYLFFILINFWSFNLSAIY
jgi:hypothetical protein